MKKTLLFVLSVTVIALLGVFMLTQNSESSEIEKLRAQHQEFLDNSPYAKTKNLPREERKKLGLPPNAYNEQMWELTMDPKTGRPMPERVMELQEELRAQRASSRGTRDVSTPWVDRGPNNQGGRTRGIMFDPNDVTNSRVFAGGVSGGLWVNDDITDPNESWTLVPGIGANISVTVIISDPNDSNTFYIGSGESYTSGDAVGRGIWKSTNGGVTWSNIFGGLTSSSGQLINGIFYINDLIARDVGATTELYAAVSGAFYADGVNQFHSVSEYGLYKSTDNGSNWTRFNGITHAGGNLKNPNDLELDINNNIWMTTTRNVFGDPGGDIYRSNDGVTFTLERTIANTNRTEIEPSPTDANKFWIVANVSGAANIYTTNDAFVTNFVQLNEPNDVDNDIGATDYTRGQAFYDLPIEFDNGNLYVGGIDLFRSTDDGTTWIQMSKWSNNLNLNTINVPFVHADHHAIVFRPGATNEVVFGTDGGVFYTDDVTQAVDIGYNGGATPQNEAIEARNKDYNTIQFYYGAIDPVDGGDGDDLIGGTQDNGTQFVVDAAAGANNFFDPVGGDGAFTEIDDSGSYMIQSYPGNSHRWINYPTIVTQGSSITTLGGGNFINEAELDKNLDIFYCNATSGTPRIERSAEFIPGGPAQTNTPLTNALLDSSPSAFKISPFTAASSKLFAGLRNGRLLQIDNADTTPTWADISGSFVGSVSDIEFGQNEQEMFVTMHNYGVNNIWYTSNGGTNWASKDGNLPDLPVKCILQNPLLPNEVIIGTELGIWGTADISVTNPTWIQLYNGMSDVTVVDLDLRASDNVILASTHGRGFFTSQFTSAPLGIEDNDIANSNIKIFPKVSNGNFTVKAITNLGQATAEFYNLSGKRVHVAQLNLDGSDNSLTLNSASGMYIVKIIGESFTVTDKIIIK